MTSAFSRQNSASLCPALFCAPKAKLTCYSPRYLLTSQFCIPISNDEKDIFFWCQCQKDCRSSQNHSTARSSSLVLGAQTWITVILNGLPQKQTEIILSFLRLHPNTIFQTLVDYEGYSISSKGFFSTIVDIMVI